MGHGPFFDNAPSDVPANQIEGTITPRAGVTIVSDKAIGMPDLHGTTRSGTEFGAGRAAAGTGCARWTCPDAWSGQLSGPAGAAAASSTSSTVTVPAELEAAEGLFADGALPRDLPGSKQGAPGVRAGPRPGRAAAEAAHAKAYCAEPPTDRTAWRTVYTTSAENGAKTLRRSPPVRHDSYE